MEKTSTCLLCRHVLQGKTLHIGDLPPCNQFQQSANAPVNTFPLSITQCEVCGLIQLTTLPDIAKLVPTVSWIKYNEPEQHLNDLSSKLTPYLLNKNDLVYGVGPFDQPLLAQLEQRGIFCKEIELLKMANQHQLTAVFPYLETLQTYLNTFTLHKMASQHGKANGVICRYLLEHCHDPMRALISLQCLIIENGFLLIEVPDSTKFLARKDYSFIWEEHVTYFTEHSFIKLLQNSGYQLIELLRYEGILEDALIAIAKPISQYSLAFSTAINDQKDDASTKISSILFENYVSFFYPIKQKYHELLTEISNSCKKIVIFGAGHQTTMFIHALNLASYISCVIDDNINKQHHFLPGSNISIVDSSILSLDANIALCLLAIHPHLEGKIKEKFDFFFRRGGKMYSIFSHSMLNHLMEISA